MCADEIFSNPTVKQVIFQIQFPNLFYIEQKIGEYQLRVMQQFPESKLIHHQRLVFAEIGPEAKLEDISQRIGPQGLEKIWNFKSKTGVNLNIKNDSLDLVSTSHKTYAHAGSQERFRDLIEFAVGAFLSVTPIPIITRIGLRYIDECPVPPVDNATFRQFYNTTFPLDRYPLDKAIKMEFSARVRKERYYLQFRESFVAEDNKDPKLVLDFDGFSQDINANEYLAVTDALHELIRREFFGCIKDPVLEYMRRRAT